MKVVVKKVFIFVLYCLLATRAQSAVVDSAPTELTPTVSALHTLLSDPRYPEDPMYYANPSTAALIYNKAFTHIIKEPIIPYDTFSTTLHTVNEKITTEQSDPERWIRGEQAPTEYIQKIIVPAGAQIAIFGDLHGSAHSLARSLDYCINNDLLNNDFTIKDPEFYLVFLGDFIDRGMFGPEVIHQLGQLKVANPNRVFLISGNHEIGKVSPTNWENDLLWRYGEENGNDAIAAAKKLFTHLPRALYLGTRASDGSINYFLFTHATFDVYTYVDKFLLADDTINYCAKAQLPGCSLGEVIDGIIKKDFPDKNCRAYRQPFAGYTWFHFTTENVPFTVAENRYCLGREIVQKWLNLNNHDGIYIRGIMRGHQHSDRIFSVKLEAGQGYCSIMDNRVHTIISAPAAGGIFLPFDSFVLLTTAADFEHWTAKHISRRVGFFMKEVMDYEKRFRSWLAETFGEKPTALGVIRQKFLDEKQLLLFNLAPSRELDKIPWRETAITLLPAFKEKITEEKPSVTTGASSSSNS